ncbi:sce7726 family protein [Phyllobacterium sp. 22229]|uniref:sce7726 family protein n=1 Tax=Phyllobacterium sp. 22229 TaxID=3453895 RepID=UPI003F861BEB
MNDKIDETRIKCELLLMLRRSKLLNARSVLSSEYVIGSTGRRADLAILNGTSFVGIEIKSRYDSLARLSDQLEVYRSCFTRVMLVVDERHVESATLRAGPSIEIWKVDSQCGIQLHRPQEISPMKIKSQLLKMLTTGDLKRALKLPSNSNIKKKELIQVMSSQPEEDIFREVIYSFKQVYSETSSKFWAETYRKNISPQSLQALSRFASVRIENNRKQEQQHAFWDSWREAAKISLQDNWA